MHRLHLFSTLVDYFFTKLSSTYPTHHKYVSIKRVKIIFDVGRLMPQKPKGMWLWVHSIRFQ